MHKLIHRGSVKDVYRYDQEHLLFRFSNRYSIFDWGAMPDEIIGKGEALAKFSRSLYCKIEKAHFWQQHLERTTPVALRLKQKGLKTHQRNIDCKANEIIVAEVSCDRENLEAYQNRPNFAFIPLEVIFRCGVPAGSSLLQRYKGVYQEGQELSSPLIEFSTKWEKRDRMLSNEQAQELAGLTMHECQELQEYTVCLAQVLKSFFASRDLKLWDGKVEWAFVPSEKGRTFMLVDSIGPDELRLTHDDIALSKEFLRQWYRKSDWFHELQTAKKNYGDEFKFHCGAPQALNHDMLDVISKMYQQLADLIEQPQSLKPLTEQLERLQ